jgi:anti-anti-sigma factor
VRIQEWPLDGRWVMTLHGIINLQAFFQLDEAILRVIKKSVFKIELEMSDVKHMDYRGVEILVKRAERLRGYGGALVLKGLSPYLVNILQMAGAVDQTGAAGSFKIEGGTPETGDLFTRDSG